MQRVINGSIRFVILAILASVLILSSLSNIDNSREIIGIEEKSDKMLIEERIPDGSEYKFSSLTANLSEEYIISNNMSNPYFSDARVLCDSKNNTHYLWNENRETSMLIFYRIFYYNNQTFGEIQQISDWSSGSPQIFDRNFDAKIDSTDRIYVVWQKTGSTFSIQYATIYNNVRSPVYTLRSTSEFENPAISVDSQQRILIIWKHSGVGINGTYFNGVEWQNIGVYPSYSAEKISLTIDSTGTYHALIARSNRIYYLKNTSVLNEENDWMIQDVSQSYSLNYDSSNPQIIYNSRTNLVYGTWEYELGIDNNRIVVINKTTTSNSFSNAIMYQSTGHELYPFLSTDITNTMVLSVSYGIQTAGSGAIRLYLNITKGTSEQVDISLTNSTNAKIEVDLKRNVHVIYYSTTADQERALYKIYDRDGPNLVFKSPLNGTATNGNLNLNVSVAPDIFKVSYYYFEGTSPPSNPNDWQHIVTIVNDPNGNYNYTWVMNRDYLSILILANASDRRMLDEAIIHEQISVDIYQPQIVSFVSMVDSQGRDVQTNKKGIGNIIVTFNVFDNCSGIDYVQLWNGTTLLATNQSGDASNTLTWASASFPDGNYSNLYLRAYDRAGWSNVSAVFPTWVLIDNTKPIITDFYNLDGKYITGTYKVRVLSSSDTANITMYYKNSTLPYTKCVQNIDNTTGLMNNIAPNTWELNWRTVIWIDSQWQNLDGFYEVMFEASDNFGNNNTLNISVYIDNTIPSIVIIKPIQNQYVGYDIEMEWLVASDTNITHIYHSGTGTISSIQNAKKYIPDGNASIIPLNSTHSKVIYQMDAYQYRALTGEEDTYFAVVLNCTDRVGLTNASIVYLRLNNQRPFPAEPKSIYALPTEGNKYKVEVSFSVGSGARMAYYLVYRSLTSFSVEYLNSLSITEMLNILGRFPGDKYCIGRVEYTSDILAADGFKYTDSGLSINTYYYTVLLFNQEGNPSRLHSEISVKINIENPEKDINWDNFVAMPYVLGGIIGLLGLFAYTSIKATKTVRTSKEVKKTYKEVFKEDEDFDLDKQFSALASLAKKQDVSEDEFLNMKVEKETPLDSGVSKIRKCEHCGWLLSADATICPRCQKTVM